MSQATLTNPYFRHLSQAKISSTESNLFCRQKTRIAACNSPERLRLFASFQRQVFANHQPVDMRLEAIFEIFNILLGDFWIVEKAETLLAEEEGFFEVIIVKRFNKIPLC